MLEAMLLLDQYGPLWVKYRGTAESLKRERWLLLARAGEYAGLADDAALHLLAERVEAVLDVEHREWVDEQKQALARMKNTGTSPGATASSVPALSLAATPAAGDSLAAAVAPGRR